MNINPNFINFIKTQFETEEEQCEALFVAMATYFSKDFPYLLNYFLDKPKSVIPYEKLQLYTINLIQKNAITGNNELKIPLFGVAERKFNELLKYLTKYNVNAHGHLNNSLKFTIFGDSETDEHALQYCITTLGERFDMDKLAIVISLYYEQTLYPTKLDKFLISNNIINIFETYLLHEANR